MAVVIVHTAEVLAADVAEEIFFLHMSKHVTLEVELRAELMPTHLALVLHLLVDEHVYLQYVLAHEALPTYFANKRTHTVVLVDVRLEMVLRLL